jgi:hypothetical protein
MPFLAEEHIDIPTTDLLSWMFDAQTYDTEKAVMLLIGVHRLTGTDWSRYTSTQQIQHVQSLPTRPEI